MYSSQVLVFALLIINALTDAASVSRREEGDGDTLARRRELGDDLSPSTVIQNLGMCKYRFFARIVFYMQARCRYSEKELQGDLRRDDCGKHAAGVRTLYDKSRSYERRFCCLL